MAPLPPLPRHIPKIAKNVSPPQKFVKNVHSGIVIHDSKKWEPPKRPQADTWINKIWHSRTVTSYLAPKRNEGPIHARTWVNLENVMLRVTCGTQKATRCVILLPGNVQNRRIHRERKISHYKGFEARKEWEVAANECVISFWGDEDFWNSMVVMVAQPCEYTKPHQTLHFRRNHRTEKG